MLSAHTIKHTRQHTTLTTTICWKSNCKSHGEVNPALALNTAYIIPTFILNQRTAKIYGDRNFRGCEFRLFQNATKMAAEITNQMAWNFLMRSDTERKEYCTYHDRHVHIVIEIVHVKLFI